MSQARRRSENRRGSSVVEFALAFAVLFPLMAGVFQFGYAFFIYGEMKNAVREGARFGSLLTYASPNPTCTQEYLDAVRNMTVYGDPAGGATPVVPNLSMANVAVTVAFSAGVPSTVTVATSNYSLPAVFTTFVLNKPSSTFPYIGRYAPAGS